jgi:hypothetical protein
MPEFPIEQEYGRNIDPIQEEGVGPDESLYEVFSDIQGENDPVEELDDGSAIVHLEDFKGPAESPDFYENLAETLAISNLDKLAFKYEDLVQKDEEAREERNKQYEEGLRRTGLGQDAPGGASFMGASKVVHPVMAEACVDFAARAMKEMFPPDGPVRTKIIGEITEQKTLKAERKKDYMNWQLTEQIEEYRSQQEVMLTQLPLGGSQFIKLWFDQKKKRPCAEFVPIDDIYLPFAANDFYTASRVTEVQDITQEEYEVRVSNGLYIDADVYKTSQEPDETDPAKANNRIEGKNQTDNVDGVRRIYHIYTWLELEDDKFTKGERAPYILMIDKQNTEVLGLYRNWEDGDDTFTKLDWLIEFKFIPWRGAYAIGLPHLIGGLSAALTGALRALLDSAHINTAATMLKLKGGKVSGQSLIIEPTQVTEIEGAPGVDDVRKIAMPMPFNPPSPVLFQLLGWLTDAAKGVITTSEEKIANVNSNTPVGTAQSLIEQGAAVYSSIHSRLHDSQRRVLRVLARLNRWHLEDQRKSDVVADLPIESEDFKNNSDVIPVSDPNIFAESQRYAQVQALAQRAAANPDLYNRLAVEKRILKQIRLPDVNEVLPDPQDVKDMNPALENVAMTLGSPIGAFPQQDHIAHMLSHIQFSQDPIFGANPIIAPKFGPAVLEHLKQHLTLWYLNQTQAYVESATGKPYDIYKIQSQVTGAQKLIAASIQHVHQDSQEMLGEVGQQIQMILQQVKQMTQSSQVVTPDVAAQVKALTETALAETKRKAEYDQSKIQLEAQKLQQTATNEQNKIVSAEQIEAAKITNNVNELTLEQQFAMQAQQQAHQQQMQQMQLQQLADAQKAEQQAMQQNQPAVQPPQGE